MKQKIILGVLITSIFLTLFSVNVSASEEETTTNITLVEETQESIEIDIPYQSYVITHYGNEYNAYCGYDVIDNKIECHVNGNDAVFSTAGQATLDIVLEKLKNGDCITSTTFRGDRDVINAIIYSSHDVYYDGKLVFRQTPLMESSQAKLAVGKMTSQQIVQATLKQKVYLLPFLIASVVGFLAFRKGLAMLFRTLGKA